MSSTTSDSTAGGPPTPPRGRPWRVRSASSGKRHARSRWSSGGIGPCSTTRPGPARWLEAAGGIVQPDVEEGSRSPNPARGRCKGEPLRVGRDPSVTALMLRRAGQIERMGNPQTSYDQGFAERLPDGFRSWRRGMKRRRCPCSRT